MNSQQGKRPGDTANTMVKVMMPMDANIAGNVFGGAILKLIEETAWIVALRHARASVVTASIERMDFLSPVHIGDMIRMMGMINHVHRSSMEIGVRVEAENPFTGEVRHTGTCFLTYVALDKNGKATPVPPLIIESEEEKRRWAEAEERRRVRLKEAGKPET
jgi:acyl-CoA hydrolase